MTVRELLSSLQMSSLINESSVFMADQETYLEKVVSILKHKSRGANQFAKYVAQSAGGEFLYGMHWIFALIDNLQCRSGEENWLERTLVSRDDSFYKIQAGLAIAKFGQFAQGAMAAIDKEAPILKDYLAITASFMRGVEQGFRVGALFGIEILLRIEEHDSTMATDELHKIIH